MTLDKTTITSWFKDEVKTEIPDDDEDSDGELPSMSAQFSFFKKEETRDSYESDEIDDEIDSEPETYDDNGTTRKVPQNSGELVAEDREWGLCPNAKGEPDRRLWIQVDKNSELVYLYRLHSRDSDAVRRYVCSKCINRGKYSKILMYVNNDGTHTLYESSKHMKDCEKTRDSITASKRKYVPPATHREVPKSDWFFGYSIYGLKNGKLLIRTEYDSNLFREYIKNNYGCSASRDVYYCSTCKVSANYITEEDRITESPEERHKSSCKPRDIQQVLIEIRKFTYMFGTREEIQRIDQQLTSPLLQNPEFKEYRVVPDMNWYFGMNNKCEFGARIIVRDPFTRSLGREYARTKKTAESDQVRYLCLFCIKKDERKNTILIMNTLENGFKVVLEPPGSMHASYCNPRPISHISEKQMELGGNRIPEFCPGFENFRLVSNDGWILGFNKSGVVNGRLIIMESNDKSQCREYGIHFHKKSLNKEKVNTEDLKCTYYCTTCSGKRHSCAYLMNVHGERRVVADDIHAGMCVPKSLESALEKQKENEEIYKKRTTEDSESWEITVDNTCVIPENRWYLDSEKEKFYIVDEDNFSTGYYYVKSGLDDLNNYVFKCINCEKAEAILQILDSGEITVNAEFPHPRYCKPKLLPSDFGSCTLKKDNFETSEGNLKSIKPDGRKKRTRNRIVTSEPPQKKVFFEESESDKRCITSENLKTEINSEFSISTISDVTMEKPSTKWLKAACEIFGIPPTDAGYSIWAGMDISGFKIDSFPIIKKFKKFDADSDTGFMAISYLISGSDSQSQVIKNQINKYFFDHFGTLGVVGGKDFSSLSHTDAIFKNTMFAHDVTSAHLASVSKMINCPIFLLDTVTKEVEHYRSQENEDSPTLILGKNENGFFVVMSM